MRKEILLAGCGVGLGAGLLYVLDPVYGRRRRALIRDKALHAAGVSRVVLGKRARDIGNRLRGVVAEAGTHLRREEVSDEALAARVRSKLGRVVSRPCDVEVLVSEGRVTLRGVVRSQEAERLMRGVSRVRGVRAVDDQLKLKRRHGEAPSPAPENGNGAHNGHRHLTPGRLVAAVAGSALALYGAKRRGALGPVMSVVGVKMLRRGLGGPAS
ncbi:MAG TPA: BON domain-containing protein [Pyrinomonadaceae bacterium]